MSRRGGTITFNCAQDACAERRGRAYLTQADAATIRVDQQRDPWRCEYHDEGADRMLLPHNLERSGTVTAVVLDNLPNHRFWLLDGEPDYRAHPVIEGPGFKAWAKDFRAGTRITVTATVTLPEGEES